MQISKSKEPGIDSQPARKAPLRKSNRTRQNGNSEARSYASSFSGFGFHVLMTQLKPLSMFEVAIKTGNTSIFDQGLIEAIDTEEKQLQAISDLYQIVKAQPKYKTLNEPVFKADESPITVLKWLLRKLGPLAKGNSWTVDTYKEGAKTRFRFVVYKKYNNQQVSGNEEYLSLDFLPFLVKRDLALHDLIIDVVALVSKYNKVPLWDEDGDFSVILSAFKKERPSIMEAIEKQRQSWLKGPAVKYLKLLKERRKIVTQESVAISLLEYTKKKLSGRQYELGNYWLKKGIDLAWSKGNIVDNTYIPHYIKGDVVSPYRLYKFVWCLHESDVVKARAFSKLSKDEKNGSYYPIMFSITKPGQVVKPIELDQYPIDLHAFMSRGVNATRGRYREYFYKKTFADIRTPAVTLLEKMELGQL